MELSESEIRMLYRESANKIQQITILSEMALCNKRTIIEIVKDIPADEKTTKYIEKILACGTKKRGPEKSRPTLMGRSKITSEMVHRDFSKRLAELMEEQEITRTALADYLHISKPALYYYVSGERFPDVINLIKLSDFFGVSIDYLLKGCD